MNSSKGYTEYTYKVTYVIEQVFGVVAPNEEVAVDERNRMLEEMEECLESELCYDILDKKYEKINEEVYE